MLVDHASPFLRLLFPTAWNLFYFSYSPISHPVFPLLLFSPSPQVQGLVTI